MTLLPSQNPISRAQTWLGFALALFALVSVTATTSQYGFAIDEATYTWVAREARLWFAELPSQGTDAFSQAAIRARFHFLEAPGANGPGQHSNLNLPIAYHLLNVGYLIGHWFLDELTALRLGNALLFAACVFATFHGLARQRGNVAGIVAALALILSPRVFGHAHLAATETPLGSLWMLSLLTLQQSDRKDGSSNNGWALRVAVLVALTLGVKLTAWFLLLPTALWLVIFRPNGWRRAAAAIVIVTPVLLFFLTPPLWHDPWYVFADHLRTVANNPWKIMTFYRGQGYLDNIPWTSGPITLFVTEPISWLLLATIGMLAARRDRFAALLALNFAMLLAARILGWIPTHDGERQFIPCYYFLAGLAGIGVSELNRWCALVIRFDRFPPVGRRLLQSAGYLALVTILLEPVVATWKYRGHGLMYYNEIVGGLAGASDLGFEVSYWFEGATNPMWRDFLKEVPKGSKIFLRPDHPGLEDLRRNGIWREDLIATGPENADYYLLYAKRAAYVITDENGAPVVTNLLRIQATAPATKEVDFAGVRLLALIPAAPPPAKRP